MDHQGGKLDIGQTLGFAIETLSVKAMPFAALTLAVTAVNGLVDTYATRAYFISTLASLAVSVLGTYFALRVRCGDDMVIKMPFGRALGLSILSSLGILVGFVLLIVPGLFLLASWAVAIPVLMAEDVSVSGALSRSMALSRGNRPQILGLLLMIWIPVLLIGVGGGMLAETFFGAGISETLVYNLVVELLSGAASVMSCVFIAEAYISISGQRSRLSDLREVFA